MNSQRSPYLRKVKPFYFGNVQDTTFLPLATTKPPNARRLLRINFKSPKDDYNYLQELQFNQGTLVCHRENRLHVAVVRESFSRTPLQMLEMLVRVQHPNVGEIFNAYFHNGKLQIVSEHLDVSLLDLEFNRVAPEEWEIATIIAKIIRAMTYLLETLPSCEVHIDSVRLSLQGDVKLVPDMHYERSREDYAVDRQYHSTFLAGILEVLMSHGTSSETGWTREALEFAAISPSDSLVPFRNHVFLNKAVSSSRLVPRVHLAMQMLCYQPQFDSLGDRQENLQVT